MTVTEATLREIQQRISQAQSANARAQIEHENAKRKAEEARALLKEEFGVTTSADAKRVLAELEHELEVAVDEVQTHLAEAGV